MAAMLGYAWDIWPGDTRAARIATGHCMSFARAQQIVEQMLAEDEDAFFGILISPDLTALVCRRSRVPGEFTWFPMGAGAMADATPAP